MDCGRCGSAQPDDARYCGQCGTPVAAVACEPGMAPDVPRPVPPSGSSTALLTVVSRSRRKVLAVTGAAVVALAALAAIGWREHWPPALFGPANAQARTTGVVHGVPVAAVRVVANLVSRNPATVRGSLAAIYSAQVNTAVLAPAGTRIRVQPSTWLQRGSDASLRALVTVPGRATVAEVVYLMQEEGRWRVLFTDVP
jgi:hypothetical protein